MNKLVVENYRTERHGQIAQKRFGSRKHHTSINQVVKKVLKFDTMRQQKIKGASAKQTQSGAIM